jgi:hypothetical protein
MGFWRLTAQIAMARRRRSISSATNQTGSIFGTRKSLDKGRQRQYRTILVPLLRMVFKIFAKNVPRLLEGDTFRKTDHLWETRRVLHQLEGVQNTRNISEREVVHDRVILRSATVGIHLISTVDIIAPSTGRGEGSQHQSGQHEKFQLAAPSCIHVQHLSIIRQN